MRPNTKKGRIGKRRVHLNSFEIEREFGIGVQWIRRLPVKMLSMSSGKWYCLVNYVVGAESGKKIKDVVDEVSGGDQALYKWQRPVYLRYYGMAQGKLEDGRVIMVHLFDEMINDTGVAFRSRRWSKYFSFPTDEDVWFFVPCKEEEEKLRKRASEKRNGWSK